MGMGRIQVWISSEGDPCRVSQQPPSQHPAWLVAVWDCCGRVLEWGGRRYFAIPAPHGHLDLEVPPGKYVVRAADGMWWNPPVSGNSWSDHGVVTVGCGDTACVTLYATSAYGCGLGWVGAIEALGRARRLPRELVAAAVRANQAILEQLTPSAFDTATQEAMLALLHEAERVGAKGKAKR